MERGPNEPRQRLEVGRPRRHEDQGCCHEELRMSATGLSWIIRAGWFSSLGSSQESASEATNGMLLSTGWYFARSRLFRP